MVDVSLTMDRLALSDEELRYLDQFLAAGDRAGFYLAYYSMVSSDDTVLVPSEVGKREIALQSKIATFSGDVGAVAYFANRVLQESRGAGTDESDYDGIYYLSQQVARSAYNSIVDDRNLPGTGLISDLRFFAASEDAWANEGVSLLFPGRFLKTAAELDFTPISTKTLELVNWIADQFLQTGGPSRQELLDFVATDGFYAAALVSLYVSTPSSNRTGKETTRGRAGDIWTRSISSKG